MTKAERKYYINQSVFGIKERKERMDCNNHENDINSADESEVCQSKVSSDMSQGIKNISDETTLGRHINDESSFHSIDHKRCSNTDESNYIIAKKLKSNESSFLIYDLNTSSMATSRNKAANKIQVLIMTMNCTIMRCSNRYHWIIHSTY